MNFVTKADESKVPLDLEKVKKTCIRAGYNIKLAHEIVKIISEKIYDEISTRKIYKMILETLSKRGLTKVKYRYQLKESLIRLGHSGLPFESYICEVLDKYGYSIESTRIILLGKCVS